MTKPSNKFVLSAAALAVSALLAACGGGEAGPPPDVVAPTLAITDNVSDTTATAAVTFTFTFSEDVGSSFTAEDIAVTGGTAGSFTKVDATHYTLAVTPAENAAGTITVNVDAAKFSDLSSNANTAASTASQAYNTVVVTPPPVDPGAGTVLANFDDILPANAYGGEGGEGSGISATPPAGGTGSAYQVLRSGGQPYALAVLEGTVPITADRKTLSARVYSPTAGIRMVMKLEGAGGATSGEVDAAQTVVVGWQTLTWTFSAANPASTYNKIVLLPNLGTVDAPPGKSYYFDNITLQPAAVAPPPTGSDTVLANFDDVLPANAYGGEGGEGSGISATPPAGGSGSAYQVLRSGGQPYALAVLEGTVPITADRKTLSARVYSPTAGIPMVIKLEGAGGATSGEVGANQAVVVGWQTLTWTFSGANPASTYNKIVLLPNLGTVDAPPGKSYYFDDIKLLAAAVAPPPTGTNTVLANFDDILPTNAYGGEGGEGSGVSATPPAGGSGSAYQVLRSGGQPYALAVLEGTVPITADRKTLSARVYSPTAGIPMVVKLEGPGGANSGEVGAAQTVVVGWQTLTWTFSGANPASTYNKIVLLPNLGTVDAPPGKSYYFDDITLLAGAAGGGGGGGGGASSLPVTFDDSAVTYTLRGFEGADATLATDPAGGTNKVAKVVKAGGAPWYAGAVVSTGANESIATIPFTSTAKTMKLRVYSPGPGMLVRLKVENASDVTITCETDATTVGTGWETLTFNFANPGLAPPVTGGPTAALDVAKVYNKAVVFMNVAPAAVGVAGTFYFDDLAFGTP